MTVTMMVPSALRTEVGGASRVEIATSGTLADVMRELDDRWPRLARRIQDEQGALRRFVNVYVDGEDVRRMDGMATPVRDGAEVQVIPSVAGGAC